MVWTELIIAFFLFLYCCFLWWKKPDYKIAKRMKSKVGNSATQLFTTVHRHPVQISFPKKSLVWAGRSFKSGIQKWRLPYLLYCSLPLVDYWWSKTPGVSSACPLFLDPNPFPWLQPSCLKLKTLKSGWKMVPTLKLKVFPYIYRVFTIDVRGNS